MVWFLACLLVVDIALVVGALGHSFGWGSFSGDSWRIGSDGGYGELWFGAKLLLAAAILVKPSTRRAPVLGAIATILVLLVADDVLSVHQRLGQRVGDVFEIGRHFGMRPIDLGELIVFGVYGLIFAAAMVLTWRASSVAGRFGGVVMAASIAVVAVFGVIVDAVHSARYTEGWAAVLDDVLALLEDGGEIVGATVVVMAAMVARAAIPADGRR